MPLYKVRADKRDREMLYIRVKIEKGIYAKEYFNPILQERHKIVEGQRLSYTDFVRFSQP